MFQIEGWSVVRAVFDAMVDGILISDERGLIQAVNPAAERCFAYPEKELIGQNLNILMTDSHARAHDGYIGNYRKTGERKIMGIGRELMAKRRDGSVFPIHLSVSEFQLEGRRFFVGNCHDISERHELTRSLQEMAAKDSLTDCLNRRQFVMNMEQAMAACQQAGTGLAVLFIDLDGFKQVNDNHGHRIGDQLLLALVERFRRNLCEHHVLGRVGGDEFAVLVSRDNGPDAALTLASRLLQCLRDGFAIDGLAPSIGASIGISLYPEHGENADLLINQADMAMYQSKTEGGNKIHVFHPDLREKSEREYCLRRRLQQAISNGAFELHYQLQFDVKTLQPCGMEALIRWRDGDTLVSPDEFIPLARRHGLMPEITRWVIQRACKDNAWLIAQGLLDVVVSVNVCADSFVSPDFVAQVQELSIGLPCSRLEVEVTEDVAMRNVPEVMANVNGLRALGIQLAMDDFGVGYSSLSRLHILRFDKLKIDRSFVAALPSGRTVVRSIINIARSLNMKVVAEGIETDLQMQLLQADGCDWGQGFGYARPLPLPALAEWLRKRVALTQGPAKTLSEISMN